jgi:hypothetical protein
VTYAQLKKALTPKTFISENVLSALASFEVRLFQRRLADAGALAEAGAGAANRVCFLSVDHWKWMHKTTQKTSATRSEILDKIMTKTGLGVVVQNAMRRRR